MACYRTATSPPRTRELFLGVNDRQKNLIIPGAQHLSGGNRSGCCGSIPMWLNAA